MDDDCTVEFDGDQGGEYYVPCNVVRYINESMVNTSSSTIYLYQDYQQGTNSYSLSIPAYSYPRYSTGTSYRYITNAHNVSFNERSNFYRDFDMVQIFLLVLVGSVSLINLLIRRGR